jgi:hypothetical protein
VDHPEAEGARAGETAAASRRVKTILIGVGATVLMDLWNLALKRGVGIASLDSALLGRWLLHMPEGTFRHSDIRSASPKLHERAAGWIAHYSIGISLALAFVLLAGNSWLEHPTLLPAMAFGLATVAFPMLAMQPALGLGIASSRAPAPNRARLKSVVTHAVFGLGLYVSGALLA